MPSWLWNYVLLFVIVIIIVAIACTAASALRTLCTVREVLGGGFLDDIGKGFKLKKTSGPKKKKGLTPAEKLAKGIKLDPAEEITLIKDKQARGDPLTLAEKKKLIGATVSPVAPGQMTPAEEKAAAKAAERQAKRDAQRKEEEALRAPGASKEMKEASRILSVCKICANYHLTNHTKHPPGTFTTALSASAATPAKPAVEPAVEPAAKPAVEPAVEPAAKPAEPATEPAAKPAEPAAKPAEPTTEPVTEPAAEPATKPVTTPDELGTLGAYLPPKIEPRYLHRAPTEVADVLYGTASPVAINRSTPTIVLSSNNSTLNAQLRTAEGNKDSRVYAVTVEDPGNEAALLKAAAIDLQLRPSEAALAEVSGSSGEKGATGQLWQIDYDATGNPRKTFITYIDPSKYAV